MSMTLPSGGSAWAGLAAPGPAVHGARPRGLAAPGGQETALAGTAGADGARCRDLGRGDFVGLIGADGSPRPPAGVTVRLETSARVLVIDPVRLATLIGAHPEYAAEWRYLSERQCLSEI